MPDWWGETLDIYLDDESCASLNEAMRDAREGRFCEHLTGLSSDDYYDYRDIEAHLIKR